jgi:hypothetical protein
MILRLSRFVRPDLPLSELSFSPARARPFVHWNPWRPGHRMTLTLPPSELVMIRIDVDSF